LSSKVDSNGNVLLDLIANDVGISELIKEVSIELGYNYFLFAEPQGNTSLKLVDASYDDFLFQILRGSQFTYEKDKDIYIIGERKLEGLRTSKVIQLKYRSVKDIETFIPSYFAEGVEIKPFIELNAIIVSGSALNIKEIETFLGEIDRSVPVVTIELIILDVQYSRLTELGIQAGIADEPVTSSGQIYPDVNFQFGGGAINNLLGLIENQGTVNLGRVQPNFYVNLRAVEDQGYVKVRSKPRLSTLNGQKATLSIGETRYYRIQQADTRGAENPVTIQTERFEAAEANFSIEIEPFISGNEQVTLGIVVDQSDFLGQASLDAPPSTVSRKFESTIRIKNEEMIVLGGLETKGYQDTGTGVPFLARVPVIKWFFSNRTQGRDKSKLLIFVKPTVIY
jgi:type IV pilus assembly protein PilQ